MRYKTTTKAPSQPTGHGLDSGTRARWLLRPLRWSLAYLIGTFLIFFLTASAERVPSLWPMVLVPPAGAAMFALGYMLRVKFGARSESQLTPAAPPTRLIALSALWAIGYGLAYLTTFGASGPSDFMNSITNPGAAYQAKFAIFDELARSGAPSRPIQLVTLTAGLMTFLVPLTIVWWRQLSVSLRALALTGIAFFLAPFAYAGTNQGFGYVAVLVLVGVATSRAARMSEARFSPRARALTAVTLLAGLAYFIIGSIGRTRTFGLDQTYSEKVASVVGVDIAAALDRAVFYPTHGYLGLSETMTQGFVYAGGYGNSRALSRYAASYLGLPDTFSSTYPARAEAATGYPALLEWHTVYPWLASDLTFYGAVAFMVLAGLAMASWWIRSVRELDPLAIGLLAYAALFIAFVPANNQIGASQVNLIGFTTLLGIYACRAAVRLRSDRPHNKGAAKNIEVPTNSNLKIGRSDA